MATISKQTLKKEINDILKDADLSVLSAKKVRLQLQAKLGCDLISRKDEIDSIVMDFVNSEAKSEGEEENSEEEEEVKSPVKRKAPPAKKAAKKKKTNGSESDNDDDDDGSAEEYSPKKTRGGGGSRKKAGNGETKKGASKGKGKGTGFTRAYKLSPELASFMGAEEMPRHEVVKKMWAVIKERNLYDPKNKQYAICDEDLHKIMGVKKFRTFGMLKYLKPHFLN
ncbi:uncharacterized protein LOC129610444 [Condylostylus longicornis]|uniref:uncharacterized protein LOC129610444 n=1 Tax=Condylostylus longicornis TaxID=2530218 RepID=UPI00244E52B5|nr:uncharacterized protein LOC129610444 [Condylostylus longicornis]